MSYTETSIKNFLFKNKISPEYIRYILRRDGETRFYMLDNRVIGTLIPMSHFQAYFSDDDFTRINKSVLICNRQVVNVNNGMYLMTDGTSLEGRHHFARTHSAFMNSLIKSQANQGSSHELSILKNDLTFYDNLPIPYCMVQLVFDEAGTGSGAIIRYCNKMMSVMEGMPSETFLNRSYYEINKKHPPADWLDAFSDISQNGGMKVFHLFDNLYNGFIYVACYRLVPGCCGCMFIPDGWATVLEGLDFEAIIK